MSRLLVIADPYCSQADLCNEVVARVGDALSVHVVVPVRVSHLHYFADDESHEYREAEQSMQVSVALLRARGVPATGAVGGDKPLEALTDALAAFPATHVLLATPPEHESYWGERDLLARAGRLTTVPTTQIVVPTAVTAESPAGPANVRL